MLLTQTAQVESWTYTADELGNMVRDVTPTVVNYPARLEQTDGTEITVGRSTEISNWKLFLPPDADAQAEDTVTVGGIRFEFLGPPEIARTPRGIHHIEARLRLVT